MLDLKRVGWLGAFVVVAVLGLPEPGPAELAVVVAHGRVTAGLRLSAAPQIERGELEAESSVRALLPNPGPSDAAERELGFAIGTAPALSVMLPWVVGDARGRSSVAAAASEGHVAVFQGHACSACEVHVDGGVAVAAVGLPGGVAARIARSLAAVPGDPVERLLILSARIHADWPRKGGPQSAQLVATGPERAMERIAAHGDKIGRRLAHAHLRYIAVDDIPHRLALAEQARRDGDTARAAAALRSAARLARRALQARPHDPQLRAHLARTVRRTDRLAQGSMASR